LNFRGRPPNIFVVRRVVLTTEAETAES